jgi:hypothetical protein
MEVGPLEGLRHVALGLTELGQVQGRDLFGLLDLFLVRPDNDLRNQR